MKRTIMVIGCPVVALTLGLLIVLVSHAQAPGPSEYIASRVQHPVQGSLTQRLLSFPSEGSPTATPTACPLTYTYTVSSGPVITATDLLAGSQCGLCVVPVNLPFPFTFYDQAYTSVNVFTKGNLQFTTADTSYVTCPPYAPQLGPAILPYWNNYITTWWAGGPGPCEASFGRPCGVYTSVIGVEPDRVFNVEWLTRMEGSNHEVARFEARLHESSGLIDFAYGWGIWFGPTSVGVQNGTGQFTSYLCNTGSVYTDLTIQWTPERPEVCPTYTPTPEQTRTPTRTPTPQTPAPTYTRTWTPSPETPSPTSTCGPGPAWRIVSSPNATSSTQNHLQGVDANAANDVWAVGYYFAFGAQVRTLVEHWDGAQWSIVPSPNPGTNFNFLFSVAAISADDVWAVGYHKSGTVAETLVEHWDGQQWSVVPSPSSGLSDVLYSVVALSADSIWAVGASRDASFRYQTLTQHWDGQQWTVVPSPNPGFADNMLWSATAVSPSDIWAVGTYGSPNGTETLILHWDGTEWRIVPSPNGSTNPSYLFGVAAISADDIWAVGSSGIDGSGRTLTLHWDGTVWSLIESPNPTSNSNFYTVAATATDEVWAVGYSGDDGMIQHWDGVRWNIVPSPGVGSKYLVGVSILPATDIWAVGTSDSMLTLTERYDLGCGSITTPTSTATYTAVAPTNTATDTPAQSTSTPCAITFSDVPPDSTFFSFIRCLACRGVISGYQDGSFRPNNQVTRGQIAKMVSNAAGFSEPVSEQTFQDVPPSNAFYEWIARLTTRGYMSGYSCTPGSALEPCVAPNNRPYFRPFANATRGQTSKIVANAAGFSEIPTEQTFEDVTPTHTFYREIQRLASRNIMQGYPCGGASEPCVTGKPYFRPQNNVTRGQSAKIVANTFFPNCQTP